MAANTLEPQGAPTHQLVIAEVFERLSARQKLFAHHLCRAAWHGARVIMRQTSPESNSIFDTIIELHKACAGQWTRLVEGGSVTEEELSAFLDYAALFLSNIGNYFADGGTKIMPNISKDTVEKLAQSSTAASSLLKQIIDPMLSAKESIIGYPSDNAQSSYYLGDRVTREDLMLVAKVMEAHDIQPENTRLLKTSGKGATRHLDILQASTIQGCLGQWDNLDDLGTVVRISGGDHGHEMGKICGSLLQAKKYTDNEKQVQIIDHYITSFLTGSLDAFRESQKLWVTDKSPTVDSIFGFVEPYRDPHGVRGEWEGIVYISDPAESLSLQRLVENSDTFIRLLPWAVSDVNNGKGPFEKELFEAPDFSSVHDTQNREHMLIGHAQALASCSSITWNGINLPNYNDIRETCGSKNIVVANRVAAENDRMSSCHYVCTEDVENFKICMPAVNNIATAVHELFGHGTGKLLRETSPGTYNFDRTKPPVSPLTGKPVETWYLPGQTWNNVFGEIAAAVEECRAETMSMYLMDNKELLSIFGHDQNTPITADDSSSSQNLGSGTISKTLTWFIVYYNTYLAAGVAGLQALGFYNVDEHAWGEAHRSGQFALFKHILLDGDGVLVVEHDKPNHQLTVKVDREKFLSHGKPALGRLLSRLQIWRCTADIKSCSEFYQELSAVNGEYEEWRRIVVSRPEPRWKFVQPNTFLSGGVVTLKVYDESNEGIIQSWAERSL